MLGLVIHTYILIMHMHPMSPFRLHHSTNPLPLFLFLPLPPLILISSNSLLLRPRAHARYEFSFF